MKFETTSEILRWYAKICSLGACRGAYVVDKDFDEFLEESLNSTSINPNMWADLIHEKVDIEKAFFTCFPEKIKWVRPIMICWAVDGYEAALTELLNTSPFHKSIPYYSRRDMLDSWIVIFSEELIQIGILKSPSVRRQRPVTSGGSR